VDWGQQGVIRPGSPEAWSYSSGPPTERKKERKRERKKDRMRELERAYLNSHRTPDKTGGKLQI
jgi:hypothetical protein